MSSPGSEDDPMSGQFNLAGDVGTLVAQERQARWFALFFLVFFAVLGLVVPRFDTALAPSGNWLISLAAFLAAGTIGIWVWLATSTFDPLVAMSVDSSGITAQDRRGREYRYSWSDRKLRIRLWRDLGGEHSPMRSAKAHWYLSIQSPRAAGRVPELCAERLTQRATAAGLKVEDRKWSRRSRHSVNWFGETQIHH
ncbi:MAG: hypothetical protein L3K09_06595 [Thermoplasmata archaeon]|nr:hypothetical protein [Thermoplasmata archaeon]